MKPIRDGACCVCSDENGWADNPLVYCEGPNCQVAVHQASASDSQCVLCPQPGGALKRTQNGGWAHVVCALYIPEVEFGDVHSMDPVKTDKMPESRFNQVCCLCELNETTKKNARSGACMQCNKSGCKKYFHVTCAQKHCLLREEGVGTQNVKYCGYCMLHAKKSDNAFTHRPSSTSSVPGDTAGGDSPVHTNTNGEQRPQSTNTTIGAGVSSGTSSMGALKQLADQVVHLLPNGPAAVHRLPSTSASSIVVDTVAHSSSTGGGGGSAVTDVYTFNNGNPQATTSSTVVDAMKFPSIQSTSGQQKPAKRGRPPGSTTSNRERSANPMSATVSTDGDDRLVKKPRKPHKRTVKTLLELVDPVVQDTVADIQRERVAAQAALAASTVAHMTTTTNTTASAGAGQLLAAGTSLGEVAGALPNFGAFTGLTGDNGYLTASFNAPLKPTPKLGLLSPPDMQQQQQASTSSGTYPASLEQLLERQWEMGSQFLMEQAQHFDIASLLTLLHQLKSENQRIEQEMQSLVGRRDHLLAVNARLTMSLNLNNSTTSGVNNQHQSPLCSPRDHLVSPSTSRGVFAQPMFTNGPNSVPPARPNASQSVKAESGAVPNFLMPARTTPTPQMTGTSGNQQQAAAAAAAFYTGSAQESLMQAASLQHVLLLQQQQVQQQQQLANYAAALQQHAQLQQSTQQQQNTSKS